MKCEEWNSDYDRVLKERGVFFFQSLWNEMIYIIIINYFLFLQSSYLTWISPNIKFSVRQRVRLSRDRNFHYLIRSWKCHLKKTLGNALYKLIPKKIYFEMFGILFFIWGLQQYHIKKSKHYKLYNVNKSINSFNDTFHF